MAYNRRKTSKFRADNAHLEIRVPDILKELFEKYKSNDQYLFNFHERYTSEDAFNSNVNGGLRRICEYNNMQERYSTYTFRHSWGTIARNDIKASMYDVAFSMNHASAHKITETYVKPDYSIVSDLNQKVVDFIFYGRLTEDNNGTEDEQINSQFKFSFRNMIMGTVFFNDTKIYSFKDIGYNNVDDVITELVKHLPEDMPVGCKALFRIDNLDKGTHQFYERQKGKGF